MKSEELKILTQSGYFNDIDLHFAGFITRLSGKDDPEIFLGAALASRATANGDVCLDLGSCSGKPLIESETSSGSPVCPELSHWQEKLLACPAVGRPGEFRPLILDEKNRLYLYRYWEYEKKLSESILDKVKQKVDDINIPLLAEGLNRLFPESSVSMQKIATVVAILKRFCVISGGPGTGKTSTVAKILALLLEQKLPRIFLTAPTGKAAAGLLEAIERIKPTLNCPEAVKNAFPCEAFTIHRLLKPIPHSPYFFHNRQNPLAADVIVVDEASMMDLALMSKLMEAVPANVRMILLGDKDQLASVEAGSVLGDVCGKNQGGGFSESFRCKIEAITGEKMVGGVDQIESISHHRCNLQDSIVFLSKSYRFSPQSDIAKFSNHVNAGDFEQALRVLKHATGETIRWVCMDSIDELYLQLEKEIVRGYRAYLRTSAPNEALKGLERFKILCAVNQGPLGVEGMNRLAEAALREAGLISQERSLWYSGRPVLITRNDYYLGLFNGDMGIALSISNEDPSKLMVYFPGTDGKPKEFSPYRISEHETAYAVTIHKSQGAEFDHVLLILPNMDSPVLTRQLIYTAVTRARKSVTVYGSEAIIRAAISRTIDRISGLQDALWG
ncbi:MAG: exodeoxyribonuclease V subunit alpha [Deltaproteobacteria bacterium]|nr:exodeoxyribonuclease V subunit alpha [Deltaproteobacteria bacterium]MBW2152903.1 exodeoxyribonuclease V subunit alpha [Deltaproteobacteria bacterium]